VRLNRIRLLNFRQHADTEIEFDTGITGIIGANGAGKSTILEAIAWALYGGDTARGGKDTIRFSRAEARASVRVELDFELGGHRYSVVRGLTMAELFLDGAEAPLANSATSVGELLQRRLGMTRSEFFNTYFTGQKELAVMATLTATERAQFLSRVLGYEKLRTAQELSDVRRRELRSEITGMRSGMLMRRWWDRRSWRRTPGSRTPPRGVRTPKWSVRVFRRSSTRSRRGGPTHSGSAMNRSRWRVTCAWRRANCRGFSATSSG